MGIKYLITWLGGMLGNSQTHPLSSHLGVLSVTLRRSDIVNSNFIPCTVIGYSQGLISEVSCGSGMGVVSSFPLVYTSIVNHTHEGRLHDGV